MTKKLEELRSSNTMKKVQVDFALLPELSKELTEMGYNLKEWVDDRMGSSGYTYTDIIL